MNWLFRRHFWIVHLMFLCIVAAIFAKTASALTGYWLSKVVPETPPQRYFTQRQSEPVEKNYEIANDRNLFAARREQISEDFEQEPEAITGDWRDAQPSSLPLKLVSTMVFVDPFDSRAVILDISTAAPSVYSLKGCAEYQKSYDEERIETVLSDEKWQPDIACNKIGNMATLMRIEEFRVYIFNERDKRYEYLTLLGQEERPRARSRTMPRQKEVAPGAGVRKVGATSYQIDQSEFDKALSNVARLMTEARAVPEIDNGNFVGFKIIYLKDDSLFQKIGIERLDVLTRINGYELDSPEKALQLFGRLRAAKQFTIDLKRGGRSVTLDYSVVR